MKVRGWYYRVCQSIQHTFLWLEFLHFVSQVINLGFKYYLWPIAGTKKVISWLIYLYILWLDFLLHLLPQMNNFRLKYWLHLILVMSYKCSSIFLTVVVTLCDVSNGNLPSWTIIVLLLRLNDIPLLKASSYKISTGTAVKKTTRIIRKKYLSL
jgi:hypothetical protein